MVTVSRILHAGYIFETDGVRIAFDPIFETPFSTNCHSFPSIEFDLSAVRDLSLSAIFISHTHDDHCSLESLALLDRTTSLFIFDPTHEMSALLRELGFASVRDLNLGEPVVIGTFRVTPLEALDADVDSIFHIEADGLNILNVVDSWIGFDTMEKLERVEQWDLVLWPFQTMRELDVLSPSNAQAPSRELPPEWIEQIKRLNPRAIVPGSCQFQLEPWSWYNTFFFPISYRQFTKEIAALLPQTHIVRLNPGTSIDLDAAGIHQAKPLNWIHPVGDQNIDYDLQDKVIPSTSEIARNFPAPSSEQVERVDRFCRIEIPQRRIETDISPSRIWRLTVYNHLGKATVYHYRATSEGFVLTDLASAEVSWTTEVPLFKLYSALENGESLTSMYVRINDERFSPEAEANLKDADVLMDPLVQFLFTGAGAAYQRAQLKKIRSGLITFQSKKNPY